MNHEERRAYWAKIYRDTKQIGKLKALALKYDCTEEEVHAMIQEAYAEETEKENTDA